jgi:hypothetical protein
MCYVATHPEKLDESRADQWRKVTRLTPAQFAAVTNLEFLGVPVFKRKGAGGLFFGRKRKRNVRKVQRNCLAAPYTFSTACQLQQQLCCIHWPCSMLHG